jgi:hypothetical protein
MSKTIDSLNGDWKLGSQFDLPSDSGNHHQGRLATYFRGESRVDGKLEVFDELDKERLVFINAVPMC